MTLLRSDAASAYGEIIATLNLYGVAVDARRWHLLIDVFTPGVQIDYFGQQWNGLAPFCDDFAAAHANFTVTQHLIGNHVVRLDRQAASALSYCQWRLVRAGMPGGDAYWGTAWYDDRLVPTDQGWRVARRVCGILWADGNPAVAGTTGFPPLSPLHEAGGAGLLALDQGATLPSESASAETKIRSWTS